MDKKSERLVKKNRYRFWINLAILVAIMVVMIGMLGQVGSRVNYRGEAAGPAEYYGVER